ncbi:hypothetical protein [Chitinophaga niabensis]|uniref:Uncharacterized protein n=1 Tax=Chitinophaga niabensis TaxID=536979 RepID=A0A1N6ERC5_9BACT|nr:hypothetical protein [Chitinophaga niabensis]SIN85530.1 hypothetical protein SAMN04488055_1776 [Chitinophaga niabensis]
MEEKIIIQFLEFLNKSILQDQTHLVNITLYADKDMKYFHSIYNREEYRVRLSDEEIFGTEAIIAEKQKELEKELAEINRKVILKLEDLFLNAFLQRKLQIENDLKLLEDARSSYRYVYQWLLIPHWLGDELISLGEVVFREFGCNFWGITSFLGEYQSREATLLEVFEELHNY